MPEYVQQLHLGSGKNTIPHMWNVDRINHDGVDEVVDLSEYPWPWDDGQFQYILAEHVFEHLPDMEATLRECARILKPGGRVEIAMPVGQDSWADPDHKHRWTWDTPEFYCGKRPWDPTVGLNVVSREVDLWPHGGGPGLAYGALLKAALWVGSPGRWCFDLPATSGEFRVVFGKV